MSYSEKLVGLIDLIRTDSPAAKKIIETLKSGDERRIREMLMNLDEWGQEFEGKSGKGLAWTKDEIEDARRTARSIKPDTAGRTLSFWAW